MINNLFLCHRQNYKLSHAEKAVLPSECFTLQTCQRTLLLATLPPQFCQNAEWQVYRGAQAYEWLLETICGLKSKLIGEHEIVRQFKDAYNHYLLSDHRNKMISIVLQKLFLDAKSLRTDYLVGLGQRTYGSIVRKMLQPHIQQSSPHSTILISGSGQMAEEITQYLCKYYPITLSARNEKKVESLAQQHRAGLLNWQRFKNYSQFPFIINTISSEATDLFCQKSFEAWRQRHPKGMLVDLSSPSLIKKAGLEDQRIRNLEDVYQAGALRERQKIQKIIAAKKAILTILEKRVEWFHQKEDKQRLYGNAITSQSPQIQLI